MGVNKRLIGAGAGSGGFVNEENFGIVTYTGNSSDQSITGLGFKPDFVWIKERSQADNHNVIDSSRGTNKIISPNLTNAEFTSGRFTSFDSDGFTLANNNETNDNGVTYVAWCWKANGGSTSTNNDGEITTTVQANQDAGFSIVTFDGITDPGEKRSFGHGLSQAPEFIWMKRRGSAQHPAVFAQNDGSWGYFDGTSSTGVLIDYASNITVNSTVIDIVDLAEWFADASSEYVYWCWHSVPGYSKIGTYEGNGSTNGPIVETGFEPAFLMIKRVDTADAWYIYDNKRNTTNPRNKILLANSDTAELTNTQYYSIDFLSNGFQPRSDVSTATNDSGGTYLYMAFAANPDTEAPTLANSFNIETYGGNSSTNSITGLGFSPNFIWLKERSGTDRHVLIDTLRGQDSQITTNNTDAETTFASNFDSFDTDGFTLGSATETNGDGEDYVAWTWKADDNEPTIFGGPAKAVYKFEDNVNDVTGNFNGSATSITYNSSGKYNKSAVFNGTNSRITNTSSSISTTFSSTSITISAWFKFSATLASGRTYMVVLQGGGYQEYVGLYLESNKCGVIVGNFTQDYRLGSDDVNDGNWHHLVLTREGQSFSGLKAYLDGSPMSESATGNAGGGTLTFNTISLGYNSSISSNYFNGELDQVRIYRGAITDTQVAELYAETVSDNDDLSFGGPAETIVSANANAGFSIVKYTGIGANLQVPHGLSSAPELLIIKGLETTNDWAVLHKDGGDGDFLQLNSDSPESGAGSIFGSTFTRPTATYFTVGNTGETGTADKQYIALCFHSVSGYSKIGSYTGSTTGVTVTVGFKPDFLLIKSNSNTEHWAILDTRRGTGKVINPNRNNAESASTLNTFTVSDTGFSFPHQDTADAMLNENGYSYIYLAIAKNVPSINTLANSFKAVTYTGTGSAQSITGLGFKPDLTWFKDRGRTREHILSDSVRGAGREISSDTADAEETDRGVGSFDTDGFSFSDGNTNYNDSGQSYVAWCWKAGNTWQSNGDGSISSTINANTGNGFSIVRYRGAGGSSAQTLGHGLSSAPEWILTKKLGASQDWHVYHKDLNGGTTPANYFVKLNSSAAESLNTGSPPSVFAGTEPTSTVFSVGSTLQESDDYIAYCWHGVSGFSKFGSYTGNGSSQDITGLGFQPDFVINKARSSSHDWNVTDSARGNQKGLNPNTNAVEGAQSPFGVTFISDGFTVADNSGGGASVNGNGIEYIYMAFKMN